MIYLELMCVLFGWFLSMVGGYGYSDSKKHHPLAAALCFAGLAVLIATVLIEGMR